MNNILEIGDFAYNTFLPLLQENCPDYILPKHGEPVLINSDNIQNTFQHYVLSRETLERLPSLIKKTNAQDKKVYQAKEALKLISNDHCLNSTKSRAHVSLIKNN